MLLRRRCWSVVMTFLMSLVIFGGVVTAASVEELIDQLKQNIWTTRRHAA